MKYTCVLLSSVTCPALQYFSIFSQNGHDFGGKNKFSNITWIFLVK